MTVVFNPESQAHENLPEDLASQGLSQGQYHVALNDPEGNPITAPFKDAQELLSKGYTQPSPDQLKSLIDESKNQETGEKIKAALEGAASGSTFGLSTGLEKALGVPEENIQRRQKSDYYGPGEIAGLVGSSLLGTGEGALLSKAGEGVQALTGLGREGAGILSRMGGAAARLGTESALMSAGDENSKFLSSDPNQSAETALANIGLSGVIGAGIGAPFGAVSPIWKLANESKVGQFIEDFKKRIQDRSANPDPLSSISDEIGNLYSSTKDAARTVYGGSGIKSQAIEKFMPEMNSKIESQAESISSKLKDAVAKMDAAPEDFPSSLSNKLRARAQAFDSLISGEVDPITGQATRQATPSQIFDAVNGLKQELQEWSKFSKISPPPIAEREFINLSKNLSHDLRTSLEDSSVWGKSAEFQQNLNKAFSEYKPALKDFEKKFTSEIGGERVPDLGKIQTYLNQSSAGKASAELKQNVLKNYMDAAQKYRDAIHASHGELGIQSPVEHVSMNNMVASLKKVNAGEKLADYLVNKGLSKLSGEALGAVIGGGVGHFVGMPEVGAVVGRHALGPVLGSVLPAIAKPILEGANSSVGLKSAVTYAMAVLKGETALNHAAKALFKSGLEVLPHDLVPTHASREKLKKKIDESQIDVASLLNVGGDIGHYMPDHASAMSAASARAVSYLSSLKPKTERMGPLDSPREPSQSQINIYNRALDLAEQPLLAIKSIKDGSLTARDVQTVKTIYPALYQNLSQKLFSEMVDHSSKGEEVPYKIKMGLSLFLGQPLDASMAPMSIASNQMALTAPPLSQNAMPTRGRRSPPLGPMKNIQVASRSETQTQKEDEA